MIGTVFYDIFMFSWKEIKKPIIALAPMDGYTDSAFRQLVKSVEPRTVCYTEFISSDFLYYKPNIYGRKPFVNNCFKHIKSVL